MIELTKEQNTALKEVVNWYRKGTKQWFYLAGAAGTGKSTIIRPIIDALKLSERVEFATFTGKAANVLRRKGIPAKTIHSLIYRYVTEDEDESGVVKKIRPVFKLNRDSDLTRAELLVLDECSMISEDITNDLLSFNKKILVIGDPHQLSPINGQCKFTMSKPDYELTEIHRQALESPIIRLATLIRSGKSIPKGVFSDGVKHIPQDDVTLDELMSYEQIITGRNDTRRGINTLLREEKGIGKYPDKEDTKVICLKNNKELGIFNGMQFKLENDKVTVNRDIITCNLIDEDGFRHPDMNMYTIHFDWYYADQTNRQYEDKKRFRKYNIPLPNEFDFSYAITVHKSQGSQWDSVLVWDDKLLSWDQAERNKWLYTAITRASEKLIIAY